jgi:hypothetical protein
MELFADRSANANGNSLSLDDYVETPRANFNNFFNGFILIFTVLTGESWDMNMIIFARTYGYSSIFFFVSFQHDPHCKHKSLTKLINHSLNNSTKLSFISNK